MDYTEIVPSLFSIENCAITIYVFYLELSGVTFIF